MLENIPESIGHALVNQRAGMENVVYNQVHGARSIGRMDLHSVAFGFNSRLPTRYTADGDGVSPPLHWEAPPAGTSALALIVEDADSPTPHPLVHVIAVGLERLDGSLNEGALAGPEHASSLTLGQNSFLRHAWLPPDPPRGHGLHRYVFQLFALRGGISPPDAPGRHAFIDLVLERAIAVGCLIGTYERADREETLVFDEAQISVPRA